MIADKSVEKGKEKESDGADGESRTNGVDEAARL